MEINTSRRIVDYIHSDGKIATSDDVVDKVAPLAVYVAD